MHYMNFKEAREFSRSLNLNSASEWRKYSRSLRPSEIPSHPDRCYCDKGWINWMDWLKTNNVPGGNKKYLVNDLYFKSPTKNSFYILGFWFADGYINSKDGMFSITQHGKDRYILESILREIGSNHPLTKHGKSNLIFRIRSRVIVDDIIEIGGRQRKTHNMLFPKIPKEYLSDFIRGCWDGDGTITFQKSTNSYVSSFISASEEFVKKLVLILRKEIPEFRGTINKLKKCFVLSVGVNDTRRLRDFLYGNMETNSLFLIRKRDRFVLSGDVKIASFDKKFLDFNVAKRLAAINNIWGSKDWRKRYKIIHNGLPSNPEVTYKKFWKGWKEFLRR